jgi:hypothetical protein
VDDISNQDDGSSGGSIGIVMGAVEAALVVMAVVGLFVLKQRANRGAYNDTNATTKSLQ